MGGGLSGRGPTEDYDIDEQCQKKGGQTKCENDEDCRWDAKLKRCAKAGLKLKSGQYDFYVPWADANGHRCICGEGGEFGCKYSRQHGEAEYASIKDHANTSELADNTSEGYLNYRLRSIEIGVELKMPLSPVPGVPSPLSII